MRLRGVGPGPGRPGRSAIDDPPTGARAQLILALVVQILVLSVWFATAAVVPSLAMEWGISKGAAGWLTTAVQLGFVVGAVGSALVNLPDRVPISRLVAAAAAGAALTTALVPLLAGGLAVAIPLRFATGITLAGVYPVGAKLVASWFSGSRGLAMGMLLAALTLGSALPHLVAAFGVLPWRSVLYVTSGLALLGAVFATRWRCGPLVRPAERLEPRYVLTMFSDRAQRDVNFGYFGHMWELYALWTWLPTYLAASIGGAGSTQIEIIAFGAIGVAGALGCLLAGAMARRRGAMAVAGAALLAGAACCALSPLLFVAPAPLLVIFVLVWGAAVIGDSPMFSTELSRIADRRYTGTALTAQMAIGFLITAVAIRILPWVAGETGWRWALLALLPGPLFGFLASRKIRRLRWSKGSPTPAG